MRIYTIYQTSPKTNKADREDSVNCEEQKLRMNVVMPNKDNGISMKEFPPRRPVDLFLSNLYNAGVEKRRNYLISIIKLWVLRKIRFIAYKLSGVHLQATYA